MARIEEDSLIRLQHLRRLDLQPGDTLVVTAPSANLTQVQELAKWLSGQDFVPNGVKLAVLPGGTEVGVLRPPTHSVEDWADQSSPVDNFS